MRDAQPERIAKQPWQAAGLGLASVGILWVHITESRAPAAGGWVQITRALRDAAWLLLFMLIML